MAAVAFSYAAWVARYPEFSAVTSGTAQLYFNEATLYCDNTDASIVTDQTQRAALLNMLTAHIAAMTPAGASPMVGRVSGATEGSVSVQTTLEVPGTAAWFAQTRYGMAYWQATTRYRTMRYIPGAPPYLGPYQGARVWR